MNRSSLAAGSAQLKAALERIAARRR